MHSIKNMQEFADVSGISRPTLSKYFNDPSSVRETTRLKIEEALALYDFRPNHYAVNQNRRMTRNIGVVVPYLADPFFAEIARTIKAKILERRYKPILLGSLGCPALEVENLENLQLLKPAGVLLAPLGRLSQKSDLQRLCEKVPTVLFDAQLRDFEQSFFGSNNDQSIYMISDYLMRSGEPPAFFEMAHPTNPNAYKRRAAYLSAAQALGFSPVLLQAPGTGWEFERIGFDYAKHLIAEKALKRRTILCSNDRLAIGFLSAAFEAGERIGRKADHLRVAGHDDHPFSRYTCPTLTTVAQDCDAIAEAAVSHLVSQIEGEEEKKHVHELKDGKLILRSSA